MLDWFKGLSEDNIVVIGLAVVGGLAYIGKRAITFIQSPKDPVKQGASDQSKQQASTIHGDGNTVTQTIIIGLTQEQYTQGLKEQEQEIRTQLSIDQALSERQRVDLTTHLSEVEERLRDSTQSYQTHIASLEQRVKELKAKGQTIPRTLLDAAIAALKIGDTDKADEVLAEVELSAKDHIEAAAEAAYQRAKIAEEGIQYRKAFDHAIRASQLVTDKGQYLNLAGTLAHTLGEYDKAIGYYELALASDLATFGEDHPEVATDRNNLGGAWNSKGEYDKSIGYYELALATMKKVLGDHNPNTQTVQKNLEHTQSKRNQ